jgi:hypothetical protein
MHYALERHAVFEQTDDHAAFIGANEKARGLAHPEAIVEIRSELRVGHRPSPVRCAR